MLLPYYPTYLSRKLFGEIAALNLTTLAGYVLSGATMYLLVRYLGCGRLVAVWAALVFIVFPWHMARAEHASLLHIEVLAVLVVALVAAARKPILLRFGFVGAANLACWLTSGYFGAMAAISTVAFAFGAWLGSERRRGFLVFAISSAIAIAPAAVLGIAAVASGTNSGAGLGREAVDLSVYGLRPLELIVPPAKSWFFGDQLQSFWSTRSHGSNPTEITNYLGLLTFALAIAWLVVAVRRRRTLSPVQRLATPGLVAVFVVGLLFAAPSPMLVFGHELWMPSRLLWEVLPGLSRRLSLGSAPDDHARPPGGAGVAGLTGELARRHGQLVAGAAVVAAMGLSFVELAVEPAKPRFRTVPTPPEYAVIDRARPGIVAEYPLGCPTSTASGSAATSGR